MNNDEKFQLITENLQEVIRPQVIHDVLAEGRPLKIYWGKSSVSQDPCLDRRVLVLERPRLTLP